VGSLSEGRESELARVVAPCVSRPRLAASTYKLTKGSAKVGNVSGHELEGLVGGERLAKVEGRWAESVESLLAKRVSGC